MEKILLNSKSFDIKTAGIRLSGDHLSLDLVNVSNTLDEVEAILNNPENTTKISLVSSDGETLRIFNGFTKLIEIVKVKNVVLSSEIIDEEEVVTTGDVVTVVLDKVSATEERLSALEDTVDMLILESLGL